jgi:hypothetical protein
VAAKNFYHPLVVDALARDGWTITHDPLALPLDGEAAPALLGAARGDERIAVELDSLTGASERRELEAALGLLVRYGDALARVEPERALFLAVREQVYRDLFEEPIGEPLLGVERVRLMVFDEARREIVRWVR